MTRKTEAITISCTLTEKASLEALAAKHNCLWGNRPNISALVKAISNGVIPLGEATPELKIKAEIKKLEAEIKTKKALLK